MKAGDVPWAIFNRANVLVFVTLASDERDVWTVYTGWGSDEEIAERKTAGFSACRVGFVRQQQHGPRCGCTDCT